MTDYRLVSFDLCPFVQRSVIVLEEKEIPYEIRYIDLADKPDWFLRISPLGKVPVLEVGETVLFESAVINEFLDETTTPRLHPRDPLRRAHNRAWIEVGSQLLGDSYHMMVATDEAAALKAVEAVRDKLGRFEEQQVGPQFNGEDFSLVDAAVAPGLQRLTWCERVRPLGIFDDLPQVTAWRDALLVRPSVQRSTKPGLEELFVEYLKGRGSPTRNVEPSWLGQAAA